MAIAGKRTNPQLTGDLNDLSFINVNEGHQIDLFIGLSGLDMGSADALYSNHTVANFFHRHPFDLPPVVGPLSMLVHTPFEGSIPIFVKK